MRVNSCGNRSNLNPQPSTPNPQNEQNIAHTNMWRFLQQIPASVFSFLGGSTRTERSERPTRATWGSTDGGVAVLAEHAAGSIMVGAANGWSVLETVARSAAASAQTRGSPSDVVTRLRAIVYLLSPLS